MTRSIRIQPVVTAIEKAANVNLDPAPERTRAVQAAEEAKRDRTGAAKGLDGSRQAQDAATPAATTAGVYGAYTGLGTASPISPLQQEMLEYVMPKIADPSILQPSRALPLLRALLSDVLPALDGNENAQQLAATVIGNEISRSRELLDRLHQGLSA